MHSQIESLFDEAESRYLKPEELGVISQYVTSLPKRLEAYRAIRDRELEIMQWVADQLQSELPQEEIAALERCIRNALLTLRHCSMGMLLDNEAYVQTRLLDWLSQSTTLYSSEVIDSTLYRLLIQRLDQVLGEQANLLKPVLLRVQKALLPQEASANRIIAG